MYQNKVKYNGQNDFLQLKFLIKHLNNNICGVLNEWIILPFLLHILEDSNAMLYLCLECGVFLHQFMTEVLIIIQ